METALVTGGSGLIGKHIVSGLLKKGYAVISVDKEDDGYNDGKPNYQFVKSEVTDRNKLAEIFQNNEIDLLVHAACTVDNDLGPTVTEKEIKESAQVDSFLYRYAMTEKVHKIVLLSTDQVYDFPKSREPIREDDDLKITTNYASMKYAAEKALITEVQYNELKKDPGDASSVCCIARYSPIYTLDYTDNLMAKLKDPKDGELFIAGRGQYGFQMCCLHNLIDFILCFATSADDQSYAGIYNVSDKLLTTAADIIGFMRENHHLGTVAQKNPMAVMAKLKGLFTGNKQDEKTNYRYLDVTKLENNNMLDNTRASKLVNFRWDIHNTT